MRYNNIEIKPVNKPTIASMCSNERNTFHFTLSRKLEIIKLSEEGMLKAEIGLKVGHLHQTTSQVVNAKKEFMEEDGKCCSSEHKNGKKAKIIVDLEKVLVV